MKQAILFTAPWCEPCKAFKPHFLEAKAEYPEIQFIIKDVSTDRIQAVQHKVMSVPTLIVLTDGIVTARTSSLSTKSALLDLLEVEWI